MKNESANQAISLLEEGIVAYSKFMTDAITNLSKAFDRIVQESKAETERQLLRDFERGLQRLADVFSRCETECREARIVGRGLNDDEYRSVAQTWQDSRRAYLEAQTVASHICSEGRWRHWEELIRDLEEAGDRLDETISREMRQDIANDVRSFDKVLGGLQTEVSVELDRLLGARWRASGEEVR